ncbi:3'-5' exonuclease [Novosphingobium soli]|uniref:Exonuclease domain-containing protein n=1 Tax=Novosphingobium soli TaxID=574956 RepID=A0ABV6D0W2_9SPHN
MSCPTLIDFEASCLPEYGQSFPIEVAVARTDGSSRVWLIRPAEAWRYWDWSEEAEQLHRISRDMLETEGVPPPQVLAEMAEFVRGCDVYADADLDQYWLEVLCQGAGAALPFSVRYLGEFLKDRGFTRPQVVAALEEAKRRLPQEHLAREDARRLALVVRLLVESQAS